MSHVSLPAVEEMWLNLVVQRTQADRTREG